MTSDLPKACALLGLEVPKVHNAEELEKWKETTLKQAWRDVARTLHPDRNKAPDAEAKFKAAGTAYERLKDLQIREDEDYDEDEVLPSGFASLHRMAQEMWRQQQEAEHRARENWQRIMAEAARRREVAQAAWEAEQVAQAAAQAAQAEREAAQAAARKRRQAKLKADLRAKARRALEPGLSPPPLPKRPKAKKKPTTPLMDHLLGELQMKNNLRKVRKLAAQAEAQAGKLAGNAVTIAGYATTAAMGARVLSEAFDQGSTTEDTGNLVQEALGTVQFFGKLAGALSK
jgi:curved DNA-binding protein CbpA